MKSCPYCAHVNREGVLFCEECGHPFAGKAVLITSQLMEDEFDNVQGRLTWGTARFDPSSKLVIHIRDIAEPVTLEPDEDTVLGRSDEVEQQPVSDGLDLGPYGAAEFGVSRRHAAIRRGEDTLTLVDLGSTNGTHLNGQRLIPNQPRVLRDGDEVRLGKLVFHIFFK
ncbi:FHA domain-containing protein [Aggregatilinea lenta]|uniref:FHA domain-containing protein n=1 Tax=Aggregatilinea lenta TaxID=913108 RepID=UPI0013C2B787|nr:FHA domain-containing protein [Aggregatilinea lenta]